VSIPNSSIENVLERLQGVKRTGSGYIARCPAHDDQRPSLAISKGNDGKVLLYCHAGCKYEDIIKSLNMDVMDTNKPNRRIIAEYNYTDEAGKLLFQKIRYEPKDFRCRIPDGSGWSYKLNGCRRVLYNLPGIIKEEVVFITEGEKDADTLAGKGYTATTNFDGAGKWSPEYNQYFKDKLVYIVGDNDNPGRKHVELVFDNIKPIAGSVQIVQIPEPYKDVSDYFAAGGTVDGFNKLVLDAMDAIPAGWSDAAAGSVTDDGPSGIVTPISLLSCANIQTADIDWLWPNRIPLGMFSLIVGDPGIGKSFLSTYLASVITTGRDWADGSKSQDGSVFLFADEDDFSRVVVPRLVTNGADIRRVFCLNTLIGENTLFDVGDITHLARLEQAIEQVGDCRLILFDPITAYLGGCNANSNSEVRMALSGLVRMAQKRVVTMLGISHLNKKAELDAMYRALGSMGFVAQARAVWGVVKDKADETGETRIFSPIKTNLSIKVKGLSYMIIDGKVVFDSEPVEENINQSLMASPALDTAADFLLGELSGGKQVEQGYLMELAQNQGVKEVTLRRAKKKLGVISSQIVDSDNRKHWYWSLP